MGQHVLRDARQKRRHRQLPPIIPARLEPEPATTVELRVESEGTVDGIVMWWVLDMNPAGTIRISTSPLEEAPLPDGTRPPPEPTGSKAAAWRGTARPAALGK